MLELIRGKKTHANLIGAVVCLLILVVSGAMNFIQGLFWFFLLSALGTIKFAIRRIENKIK